MDVITSFLNTQQPPDFNINTDRGPYLVIICSAMIALSGVATMLRLLCRRPFISSSWDDWLLFIALPFSWTPSILAIISVHYFQFGKHLQHSTLSDMKDVWILIYASQIVYPISVLLTKSSIVFLLYRTFSTPQAKLYASMMIITIIAWGLSALLVAIFTCSPVHAYWDLDFTPRHCVDMLQYFLGTQIPNIVLGLLIMIPPLPYVWTYQKKLLMKFALLLVYMLGAFVITVAGLRLNTVYVNHNTLDFTYAYVDLAIWTALETNLGIACACLPAMYPMLEACTHHSPQMDVEKLSGRGSRRSSTKSQLHGSYSHQEKTKTARFSRPRRAPETATSSFGFNQPVPIYDRSAICSVHEEVSLSPVERENESPWMRSKEERFWKRLSPQARGTVVTHVSMMSVRRPEGVYMGEVDHNEYMNQGWI